jgi:hypothetical protein
MSGICGCATAFPRRLPVPEDDEIVREPLNFLGAVADVDYRATVVAEPLNGGHDCVDFIGGQRCRGFIQDQNVPGEDVLVIVGVLERPGHPDHGPQSRAQIGDPGLGMNREVKTLQDLGHKVVLLPLGDGTEPESGFEAPDHGEIIRYSQGAHQSDLLVKEPHPQCM